MRDDVIIIHFYYIYHIPCTPVAELRIIYALMVLLSLRRLWWCWWDFYNYTVTQYYCFWFSHNFSSQYRFWNGTNPITANEVSLSPRVLVTHTRAYLWSTHIFLIIMFPRWTMCGLYAVKRLTADVHLSYFIKYTSRLLGFRPTSLSSSYTLRIIHWNTADPLIDKLKWFQNVFIMYCLHVNRLHVTIDLFTLYAPNKQTIYLISIIYGACQPKFDLLSKYRTKSLFYYW